VLYRIEPNYSEDARRARYQGSVVLSAIVRKDGSIEILKVLQGLGLGLDENAVEALKKWKFSPGTRSGERVDVALNIRLILRCGRVEHGRSHLDSGSRYAWPE
jgi:protein TonB